MVHLVRHFGVSFGHVIGVFPLSLEGYGLFIPVVNGRGNGVHEHDAVHQRGRDSCGKVPNQDIWVTDVGEGNVVFEGRNISYKGGGV